MTEPVPEGGQQRTIYISNGMWEATRRARDMIRRETGVEPSLSQVVRWGLFRELRAVRRGDYDAPSGYRDR